MTIILLSWLGIFGGYLFTARTGRNWGHAACAAGAMLLTWEAMPNFKPQKFAFIRVASGEQPISEVGDPITDDRFPLSDFPLIASVNKPTYHLREGGCGHAKLIDAETAIYLTHGTTGDRVPCRNCFKTATATASLAPPNSQAQSLQVPSVPLARPLSSP